MNKMPIITSFVSLNTPYEKVAQNFLIPSLKHFNLSYDIEYFENKGSWIENIQYKPQFCKKLLLKHKESIVSLDCDATIIRYPDLFTKLEDYDIAYHELDSHKFWKNKDDHSYMEVLGGTLYFNYNEKILQFVEEWIVEQKKNKGFPQKNLQKLLERWKSRLKVYLLPLEYVAIVKGGDKVPDFIKNPCIVQHQISRKYKHFK